jgi:branched-chain amino acid aminotransferase
MIVTVWINGELLPDDDAQVSVFDHGLVAGDGVFETIKVAAGVPFAMTRHLQRLRNSAIGLGLPEPDLEYIRAGAMAVVADSGAPPLARLRITFTGGKSPLGSERSGAPANSIVAMAPQPFPADAVDVVLAPWPRNERGAMTGIKTTSYGENVRALAYAGERGGSEAIFGNTVGQLCEGTGTNVFVVHGGRLLTPPLASGCLAGVTRALVIEWADAVEEALPLEALADADEAFLSGTTRDVQPIRSVDGKALPAAPGPVTKKAAEIFKLRAAEQVDP